MSEVPKDSQATEEKPKIETLNDKLSQPVVEETKTANI